jgi:hypothetical protein
LTIEESVMHTETEAESQVPADDAAPAGFVGAASFHRPAEIEVSARPAIKDGLSHHASLEVDEGAEVVLRWSCEGAAGVRIEPPGVELKGSSGEHRCAVNGLTVFCISAVDSAGSSIAQGQVVVSTHEVDACVSPHASVAATTTGAAHGDSHIFDATALAWWSDKLCNLAATKQEAARIKNLSLAYGLRMYKALLGWELSETSPGSGKFNGCVYSVDPVEPTGTPPEIYNTLRKEFIKDRCNEWPASLPSLPSSATTRTIDGQACSIVTAFGLKWILSGATNCSCSQLAALLAAQPDGKLCVRKTAGADPVVYDAFDDGVTVQLDKPSKKKISIVRLFENSFAQVQQLTVGGVTTWDGLGKGPYQAMQLLGLGTYLGTGELSSDEPNLRLARLGDACSSEGHAFMVGDMIYVVEFEPPPEVAEEGSKHKSARHKPKAEKMLVLQSSFAKGSGELLPYKDLDSINYLEKSMSAADCDALIDNEQPFLDKVAAFLNTQPGETLPFDDQRRKVLSVTCDRVVQFSSNTRLKSGRVTVAGKFVDPAGKVDDELTRKHAAMNGISRVRSLARSKVVFARFYAHSAG